MRNLIKRPINKDRSYGWSYLFLGVFSILLGVFNFLAWDDWFGIGLSVVWVLIGLSDFRVAHLYLSGDDEPEVSTECPVVEAYDITSMEK